MSWRQLWGKEGDQNSERVMEEMRGYFRKVATTSWRTTWDDFFATPMRTVLLAIVVWALSFLLQRGSLLLLMNALTSAGWTLLATVIVFANLFLWRLLYTVPKRNFKDALAETKTLKDEKEALENELEAKKIEIRNQARGEVNDCFEKTSAILKQETVFPFNALSKAGGHLLRSNDQVLEVCDRLKENGHGHPFAGLGEYVMESEYLAFLNYVRHHADNAFINPEDGHDYLHAAEAWRLKQGHPEPSLEQSLQMVFNKAFDATPPRGRRHPKGLQVSVQMRPNPLQHVVAGVIKKRQTELSAQLTFINHGKILRTIRDVEFVCALPSQTVTTFALLGARRYASGKDLGPAHGSTLVVPPTGQEVIATYNAYIDEPNEFEQDGAEFGLSIETTDGKGGSPYDTKIIGLTVSKSPEGQVSYSGKRLENISLEKEP